MSEKTSAIAARLGRRGGKATLRKYGPKHYREMCRKAWKKRGRDVSFRDEEI